MRSDELRSAFNDYPRYVRRRHIRKALTPFFGSGCTVSFVATLTEAEKFPRPIRLSHKTLLYDRDKVVEALAARLCEPEGGAL